MRAEFKDLASSLTKFSFGHTLILLAGQTYRRGRSNAAAVAAAAVSAAAAVAAVAAAAAAAMAMETAVEQAAAEHEMRFAHQNSKTSHLRSPKLHRF